MPFLVRFIRLGVTAKRIQFLSKLHCQVFSFERNWGRTIKEAHQAQLKGVNL